MSKPVSPVRFGHDQARLIAVEELTLTTVTDPYLSLRALAAYSGCSVRWLRARLTDPHRPLPCYRLPGRKVLVRRSEFDAWIRAYRIARDPALAAAAIDRAVEELCGDLARPLTAGQAGADNSGHSRAEASRR